MNVLSKFKFMFLLLVVLTLLLSTGFVQADVKEPQVDENSPPYAVEVMATYADGGTKTLDSKGFTNVFSHVYLKSDGSAVRTLTSTMTNFSITPIESLTWCYYWGDSAGYSDIYATDALGYLEVNADMNYSLTYLAWGMCVESVFRTPLVLGNFYTFTHSLEIGHHNTVSNGVIYASWNTTPSYTTAYTLDVRWPNNHEGVVADPLPDVLNSNQALWYRTNLDGTFSVNLEITLGDHMAVNPLSQGTKNAQGLFTGDDYAWEDDPYGVNSGDTIGDSGCYLTTGAMAMNYFAGIYNSGASIDPGDLNTWLATPRGNIPGNPPIGYASCGAGTYCLVDSSQFPAASQDLFDTLHPLVGSSYLERILQLDDFRDNLANGELGILQVSNGGYNHYVLVTGITSEDDPSTPTLMINDPFENRGSTTLLAQYANNQSGIVRWLPYNDGSQLRSTLNVRVYSPLELLVVDQYGRRTGIDIDGIGYGEIPNSFYFSDYEPGVLMATAHPIKTFEITNVYEDSTFSLVANGTGDGPFTMIVTGTTEAGQTTRVIKGTITDGEVQTYTVQYDPDYGLTQIIYLPMLMK